MSVFEYEFEYEHDMPTPLTELDLFILPWGMNGTITGGSFVTGVFPRRTRLRIGFRPYRNGAGQMVSGDPSYFFTSSLVQNRDISGVLRDITVGDRQQHFTMYASFTEGHLANGEKISGKLLVDSPNVVDI